MHSGDFYAQISASIYMETSLFKGKYKIQMPGDNFKYNEIQCSEALRLNGLTK